MGYYIEVPQNLHKAEQIINMYNAIQLPSAPHSVSQLPNMAVICVVENGLFDAACYCYNDREIAAFADPNDHRRKTWLGMSKPLAKKLTGCSE
jgi:hypothetical protein